MKWTPALNSELRKSPSWNVDSVKVFADAYSISYRSVIPQIKKLGLEYATKTGKKSGTIIPFVPVKSIGPRGGNKIPTSYLKKFLPSSG